MRQHQWGAVLLVALPDRPGMLHLLGQFGEQTGRQRHNPVVPAFGPPDAEAASFEVYVFDTRIERLRNPHAAAVKQPCDQVGRVAALVLDGLKKQLRFGDRWCMARMNRPLSTERVDVANRLPQDITVKEEYGVQSLVLRAGRDITVASQAGEELLQLLFAAKPFGHFAQRRHVAAQPENVKLLCGKGLVLSPDDLSHSADCLCRIHCLWGTA